MVGNSREPLLAYICCSNINQTWQCKFKIYKKGFFHGFSFVKRITLWNPGPLSSVRRAGLLVRDLKVSCNFLFVRGFICFFLTCITDKVPITLHQCLTIFCSRHAVLTAATQRHLDLLVYDVVEYKLILLDPGWASLAQDHLLRQSNLSSSLYWLSSWL